MIKINALNGAQDIIGTLGAETTKSIALATKPLTDATNWLSNNSELIIKYGINLGVALVVLFVGNFLARVISKGVVRLMKKNELDPTITQFLSSIIRYALLVFVAIAALSQIGIQTTSFIAVIGAASLAIGLALQGSLANLAAGVLLVIFRPFRVGEYVELGGDQGTVAAVQIFATTLATSDGKSIVVPNNKLIQGNIINYSREPHRRLQIVVSVSYDSDIDQVKKVLTDVINLNDKVLVEKDITVRMQNMGDSALDFVVRVWCNNGDFGLLNFDLQEGFFKALVANKIEIPYPKMDVNVL